jgi:16S rRNA C1402 (ribose-2'-O) methylase RsmI
MRELTKKFEERSKGKISILLEREYKGEIVVGFIPPLKDLNYDIKKIIEKYKDAKFSTKDISKIVSIQTGMKKKEVYQLLLNEK